MLVPTTEQKEYLFDLTVMFQFLIGMVSTARSSEVVIDKEFQFLIGMVSTERRRIYWLWRLEFQFLIGMVSTFMVMPSKEQKEDLFEFQFLIGMVSTSKFQWKELSLYLRD